MPEDSPADSPLTDAARTEAARIADWCETQRTSTEARANAQISVVWVLLLGGLVLLLVLPRILQMIDFAGQRDSLPPAIVERFDTTITTIQSNLVEMERESEEAAALRADSAEDVQKQRSIVGKLEEQISFTLRQPFAVWRSVDGLDQVENFVVRHVVQGAFSPDEAIALGYIGDPNVIASDDRVGFLLHRGTRDGLWGGRPVESSIGQFDDITAGVPVADAGGFAIAGLIGTKAGIFISAGYADWERLWPDDGNELSIIIHTMGQFPDGRFFALGAPLPNALSQGAPIEEILLLSDGGLAWRDGIREELAQDKQDWLSQFSKGCPNLRGLGCERIVRYESTTPVPLDHGARLAFHKRFDRRGDRIEIYYFEEYGSLPMSLALDKDGRFAQGPVTTALLQRDGTVLAGGPGLLIESLTEEDQIAFVSAVLKSTEIPDDYFLGSPRGADPTVQSVFALVTTLRNERETLAALTTTDTARKAVADAAAQTLDRQKTVRDEFKVLSSELETALRNAEPARQITQIATRLAVIGLLIYLVQIVVNRYRYLQRLAGFYQARGQALRMLSVSPDNTLMNGVSLGDLTTMLSPDAIGFDKSAEPPTNHLVSLLQAGLKR